MSVADGARLVALAAIWGASFLFMRITAPVIGAVATADGRMLIAGAALVAYFALAGFDAQWRRWWRYYALIGVLNSAAPFLLYAYSALELSVGLMAVMNATSPMWGAALSALILHERLSAGGIAGLMLGIAGVAILTGPQGSSASWLSIAAALGAAVCYGLTGTVLRRWARDTSARGMAVGTQVMGGVLLLPLVVVSPPPLPGTSVVLSMLALGLVCGALGYLLYFRLIADIGATGALTVTYLIPVFGLVWGALFLGEPLSATMIAGAVIVVAGTVLVLRG
ncbi:MAG TPA: DMT family transporter [Burkholderiales bacterium]|nr:DMT family transporter [Burkholderiales bacterium]